jgi:tRNA 2-thiouridine synthesizing protein A
MAGRAGEAMDFAKDHGSNERIESERKSLSLYTFLESMLTLEEMEDGEVLRVIVDYPQAVDDVPRSLRNEGYKILGVEQINQTDWAILVQNRPLR